MALSNLKMKVSKIVIAAVLISLLIPTNTNAAGRVGDVVNTIRSGSGIPSVSLGNDGDFYIDLKSMNFYGPKKSKRWPLPISLRGPIGASGPSGVDGKNGSAASATAGTTGVAGPKGDAGATGATGATGVAAPVVTSPNCIGTKCTYKIGDTGPGGGHIFFVDYNGQYEGFNYLEAAPSSCQGTIKWSSSNTSVPAVADWAAHAVGAGSTNTTAIKNVFTDDNSTNNAAHYAASCAAGSKNDWFLGSLGEM